MYLDRIITDVNTGLPENWLTDIIDTNRVEESLVKVVSLFQSIIEKTAINLHFSILAGEYISETDFLGKIDQIQGILLNKITSLSEQTDCIKIKGRDKKKRENLILKIAPFFETEFTPKLKSLLIEYKCLYTHVESKLKGIGKLLFETKKTDQNTLMQGEELPVQFTDLKHVSLNISLAEYDFDLCVDKDKIITNLILCKEELKEISKSRKFSDGLKDIYIILQDKCNFLIKKFADEYEDNTYRIGFDTYHVDDKAIHIVCFNQFSELQGIAYKQKPDSKAFEEFVYRISSKNELNFSDYFILTKYKKEEQKDLKGIEILIADFEKSKSIFLNENEGTLQYNLNRNAHSISLNYLKNNYYSLYLKEHLRTLSDVSEKYSDIKKTQSYNYRNYFPHLKFSEWCCSFIEREFINNKSENKNLDEINQTINLFQDCLLNLKNSIDWCKRNSFIPFQLPFSESCTPFKGETTLDIFLVSSFVLPVNYEKVQDACNQLESKIRFFKSQISAFEKIKTAEHQLSEEIANAKEIIKTAEYQMSGEIANAKESARDAQKNNLQTLSIFAAIVVFASANVNFFQNAVNYKQAMIFMLVFAYCLCLFVLLIWFISSYKKEADSAWKSIWKNIPGTHWIVVFLLITGLIINLIFIFRPIGETPIKDNVSYMERPIQERTNG